MDKVSLQSCSSCSAADGTAGDVAQQLWHQGTQGAALATERVFALSHSPAAEPH